MPNPLAIHVQAEKEDSESILSSQPSRGWSLQIWSIKISKYVKKGKDMRFRKQSNLRKQYWEFVG